MQYVTKVKPNFSGFGDLDNFDIMCKTEMKLEDIGVIKVDKTKHNNSFLF